MITTTFYSPEMKNAIEKKEYIKQDSLLNIGFSTDALSLHSKKASVHHRIERQPLIVLSCDVVHRITPTS
jgi:hypothetical protein